VNNLRDGVVPAEVLCMLFSDDCNNGEMMQKDKKIDGIYNKESPDVPGFEIQCVIRERLLQQQ
jgi:hypothetical protein